MSDSIQFPTSPEERDRLRQQQIDEEETRQVPTIPPVEAGCGDLDDGTEVPSKVDTPHGPVPVGPHNQIGRVPPPLEPERERAATIIMGSDSFIAIGFRDDGSGGGADVFNEAGGDLEQLRAVADNLHDMIDRLLARKGLI